MNFSDSQPPQPYPASIRLRWVAGRALKWMWRSALILAAFLAAAWSATLGVGCGKLKAALDEVNANPALAYDPPKDWDNPALGENAAPHFAASFALLSYGHIKSEGVFRAAVETVVADGWEALAPEKRSELKALLKEHQAAFDLAAKGADRPWCRYSRQWWSDRHHTVMSAPWAIPVPELEGVREMSDALVALAHSRASEGKHREAREAIRVALAVADSLRDDPFLQSHMRRVGQISSILDNVTKIVPDSLTSDDCEAWLKIIPTGDRFDGGLERAAKWELKERVDLFGASPARYYYWQRIHYRWGPQTLLKTLRKRLADPLFKIDAAKCLRDTERLVEVWRKPYFEAKLEAMKLQQEWHKWNETWHPTAPLLWHVEPLLRLDRVQTARARCAMVRAGLEWELARVKTGDYPRTCETIDPLTGNPFRLEQGPPRLTGADIETSAYRPGPNSWLLRLR